MTFPFPDFNAALARLFQASTTPYWRCRCGGQHAPSAACSEMISIFRTFVAFFSAMEGKGIAQFPVRCHGCSNLPTIILLDIIFRCTYFVCDVIDEDYPLCRAETDCWCRVISFLSMQVTLEMHKRIHTHTKKSIQFTLWCI